MTKLARPVFFFFFYVFWSGYDDRVYADVTNLLRLTLLIGLSEYAILSITPFMSSLFCGLLLTYQ